MTKASLKLVCLVVFLVIAAASLPMRAEGQKLDQVVMESRELEPVELDAPHHLLSEECDPVCWPLCICK
ncbi:hypothetical protein PRUPE_3G164500 [Prunus persica]|uniref:Uncharacterized protein n=1 Tax=Prunus persica TaxID=3760 RepID=A0A251Q292_PRUPE|nr:hypothetical protein PRUPE_3G164500 [Prunus persica]